MKTNQVLALNQVLAKLFEIDEKTPLSLPGETRMALALLAGKLSVILTAYEKARMGIARQVGLDPKGDVLPEKREEFFAKMTPLLEADVKLKITPLKNEPIAAEKAVPLQLLTALVALGVVGE